MENQACDVLLRCVNGLKITSIPIASLSELSNCDVFSHFLKFLEFNQVSSSKELIPTELNALLKEHFTSQDLVEYDRAFAGDVKEISKLCLLLLYTALIADTAFRSKFLALPTRDTDNEMKFKYLIESIQKRGRGLCKTYLDVLVTETLDNSAVSRMQTPKRFSNVSSPTYSSSPKGLHQRSPLQELLQSPQFRLQKLLTDKNRAVKRLQQQIFSLENDKAELHQTNEVFLKKQQKNETYMMKLKEQLQNSRTQIEDLEAQLISDDKKDQLQVTRLQKENSVMRKEKDSMNDMLKKVFDENTEFSTKLENVRTRLSATSFERDLLKSEAGELQQIRLENETLIESQRIECSDIMSQLRDLQRYFLENKKVNCTIEESFDMELPIHSELGSPEPQEVSMCSMTGENMATAVVDVILEETRYQLQELQSQYSALQMELKEKTQQNELQCSTISDLEGKFANSLEKESALQNQLDVCHREKMTSDDAFKICKEEMQAEMTTKQLESHNLQKELASLQQLHAEEITAYETEKANLSGIVSALKEEAIKRRREYEMQTVRLQASLKERQDEINLFENSLTAKTAELLRFENQRERELEVHTALKLTCDEYEEKMSALNMMVEQNNLELMSQKQLVENLNESCLSKDAKLKQILEENEHVTNQFENCKILLTVSEKKLVAAEADFLNQRHGLESMHDEKINLLTVKCKQEYDQLKEEVLNYKDLHDNQQSCMYNLNEKLAESSVQIAELKAVCHKQEADISEKDLRIQDLDSALGHNKILLKNQSAELDNIKKQEESNKFKREEAFDQMKNSYEEKLTSLEGENNRLNNDLLLKEQNINENLARLSDLDTKLSNAEENKFSLKSQLEILHRDKFNSEDVLKSEKNELEAKCGEMVKEIESSLHQLEVLQHSYAENVAILKKEVASLSITSQELKEELASKQLSYQQKLRDAEEAFAEKSREANFLEENMTVTTLKLSQLEESFSEKATSLAEENKHLMQNVKETREALTLRLDNLKREYEEKLQAMEHVKTSLEQEVLSSRSTIEDLTKKIEEEYLLNGEFETLEKEMIQHVENLTDKLNEKEKELEKKAELELACKLYEERVSSFNEVIDKLNIELNIQKMKVEELHKLQFSQNEVLKKATQEEELTGNKLISSEKQIDEANSKFLQQLKKLETEYHKRNEEVNEKYKQMSDELQLKLDGTRKEKLLYENKNETIHSEMEKTIQERNKMIEDIQLKLTCLQNSLEQKAAEHNTETSSLKATILELRENIASKQQEYELLVRSMEISLEEKSNQVSLLEENMAKAIQKSHQDNISQLNSFKTEYEKKLCNMNDALSPLEEKVISLIRTIGELAKKLRRESLLIQSYESQGKELTQRVDDLQKLLHEKENELGSQAGLEVICNEYKEKCASLNQLVEELQLEVTTQTGNLEKLNERLLSQENIIKTTTEEYELTNNQLKDYQKLKVDSELQLSDSKAEFLAQLQEQEKQSCERIEQISAKYQQDYDQLNKEIANITGSYQDKKESLESLEEKLRERSTQVDELQAKCHQHVQEMLENDSKYQDLENELDQLRTLLKDRSSQLHEARKEEESVQTKCQTRVDLMKNTYEEKIKASDIEKMNLNEELLLKMQKMNDKSARLCQLETKLASALEIESQLRSHLEISRKEKLTSENMMKNCREELEVKIEERNKEVEVLLQKNKKYRDQLNSLAIITQKQDKQIKDYGARVTKLERERQPLKDRLAELDSERKRLYSEKLSLETQLKLADSTIRDMKRQDMRQSFSTSALPTHHNVSQRPSMSSIGENIHDDSQTLLIPDKKVKKGGVVKTSVPKFTLSKTKPEIFQKPEMITTIRETRSIARRQQSISTSNLAVKSSFNLNTKYQVNKPQRSVSTVVTRKQNTSPVTLRSKAKSSTAMTPMLDRSVPREMASCFRCEDEEDGGFSNNQYLSDLKSGRCNVNEELDWMRVSEIQRRNSLYPPHMRSAYMAEMQYQPTNFTEDQLRAGSAVNSEKLLDLTAAAESLDINSPSTYNLRKRKSLSDSVASDSSVSSQGKKSRRMSTSYSRPGPPTPARKGVDKENRVDLNASVSSYGSTVSRRSKASVQEMFTPISSNNDQKPKTPTSLALRSGKGASPANKKWRTPSTLLKNMGKGKSPWKKLKNDADTTVSSTGSSGSSSSRMRIFRNPFGFKNYNVKSATQRAHDKSSLCNSLIESGRVLNHEIKK